MEHPLDSRILLNPSLERLGQEPLDRVEITVTPNWKRALGNGFAAAVCLGISLAGLHLVKIHSYFFFLPFAGMWALLVFALRDGSLRTTFLLETGRLSVVHQHFFQNETWADIQLKEVSLCQKIRGKGYVPLAVVRAKSLADAGVPPRAVCGLSFSGEDRVQHLPMQLSLQSLFWLADALRVCAQAQSVIPQ